MRKYILSLLILAGCFSSSPDLPIVQGPSAKKQRQKIIVLQKKLEQAEKELRKAQDEVEELGAEIAAVQISLIRKQVDRYEKTVEKRAPSLFLEEREALYRMIQEGPSPSAFEAQVELDRILRIITELSDDTKNG